MAFQIQPPTVTHSISSIPTIGRSGSKDLSSIFTHRALQLPKIKNIKLAPYFIAWAKTPRMCFCRLINISSEERTSYNTVMAKLDDYFRVRKNAIFKRARFNRRNQLQEETAEEYITALFSLIDSCDYGNLKDEMLRDRLVVGIRDAGLSQRLQMDSELSLAKAMKLVRQNEAVKQHTNQLQDHPTTRQSADVATINKRPLLLHKKSSRSYKDDVITSRPRVSPQAVKPCF